jgi:hypothetical protein
MSGEEEKDYEVGHKKPPAATLPPRTLPQHWRHRRRRTKLDPEDIGGHVVFPERTTPMIEQNASELRNHLGQRLIKTK